jgi:type II secretory pathway component PulJ
MNSSFHKQSLPAFTLLELMTGMIVCSIVLATIFSAYHIVAKRSAQFTTQCEENNSRSALHSLLTRDVLKSDSIYRDEDGDMHCFRVSPSGTECFVTYRNADSVIIREQQLARDTFEMNNEYFLEHGRDQH